VFFGAFIAAAIVFVTPTDAVLVAKQVLVWLTLSLLALALVYGVVHGLAWIRQRRISPEPALVPQTDLAILNWRREKSVFLGTDAPQEDASWIFQLRMAELERAKAGRTSEPRPWNRLGARMFDYAIWGIVLALLLSELHAVPAPIEELRDLPPEEVAFTDDRIGRGQLLGWKETLPGPHGDGAPRRRHGDVEFDEIFAGDRRRIDGRPCRRARRAGIALPPVPWTPLGRPLDARGPAAACGEAAPPR
jgi:hypothetical protein